MKTTSSHTGGTLTKGVCSSILLAAAKLDKEIFDMKATNTSYKLKKSLLRIDEILNASNSDFEDKNCIPSSGLTYKNGYYVYCTAVFVDICGSSDMTDKNRRPVLAKIYRSFISEMVALFNGFDKCREISINGDCVWAVFDTTNNTDVNQAFEAACKANSLIDILNYKLAKKGYTTFDANIGMDYGRALMVQAGFKGSGINDIIWMGDVVNSACHLCNEDRVSFGMRILLGNEVYKRLFAKYRGFCKLYDRSELIYMTNACNTELNNWLKENR